MWKERITRRLRPGVSRGWNRDIAPDEIFLDSKNLPDFDKNQFEGRLERPIRTRAFLGLVAVVLLIFSALAWKAWSLQVISGQALREESERNRLRYSLIFADRGVVYDRNQEKLAWNIPGEGENSFAYRKYIDKPGLAHVLGYVDYPAKDAYGVFYQTELVGKDGVEAEFNQDLAGSNGLQIVEIDALSKIHSAGTVRPPQDGKNLTLSIDADLESELYIAINDLARRVGFTGGAGAIMDVETGEILALTSAPEFSQELLVEGGDNKAITAELNNPRQPFLNRMVTGLYTPGSIVKPFLALGALTEGIITPEKQILSTGSISIPNPYYPDQESVFKDWKAHGYVDMREAIAVSSDVYFYEVGGGYQGQKGLGIARIKKYLELFGFASTTNIALSNEKVGTIPDPEWKEKHFPDDPWRIGDTYHTAIGQYGVQVTPLQALRAVAAIANGGKLIQPTVRKLENKNEVVVQRQIAMKEADFKVVREGMRQSAQHGTAQGLNIPEIPIAAKTGTAELGAKKDFVNSWSIGFFPYDHPRYAFVVIMERGPRANTLGATSVMRHMFEWMWANRQSYVKATTSSRFSLH